MTQIPGTVLALVKDVIAKIGLYSKTGSSRTVDPPIIVYKVALPRARIAQGHRTDRQGGLDVPPRDSLRTRARMH